VKETLSCDGERSFVFVSRVIGPRDLAADAAIDLAAKSLREHKMH
jgi:hypothetical protein